MSWPTPGGAASSGPVLPAVPLPWTSRDSRPIQVAVVPRGKGGGSRKDSIRKVRYGAAMVAGLAVVSLTKKIVNSIPVINALTRPILDLVPTILAGPALGAAVMYGIEQGDLLAARDVVREKAQRVRQELDLIVHDVSSEIQANSPEIARQGQVALESASRAVATSVAELERTMLPVAEREYRRLEAQARQALEHVGSDGHLGRSWAGRPGGD